MDLSKFTPTPTQQKGIDAQLQAENADRAHQKFPLWTQEEMLIDHLASLADQFYLAAAGSAVSSIDQAIKSGAVTVDDVAAFVASKTK